MTEDGGIYSDAWVACVDLVGRAGATDFEIGYLDDDPANPRWYAVAKYRGARLTADNHSNPTAAAMALAERILRGAMCRCGQTATLSDGTAGCRWQLMGKRWEPGCNAPPVRITEGQRGDPTAIRQSLMQQNSNRAQRRAAKRAGR